MTSPAPRAAIRALRDAALQRNIPVLAIDAEEDRIVLGTGAFQQTFWLLTTSRTAHHGTKIASDKALAKRAMASVGVPVPAGFPVQSVDAALKIAAIIGYPVVLKPRRGNKGEHVYIDLKDDAALHGAWNLLVQASPKGGVLIEEFLPGEEYRVLVVGGKVVAANHRIPPAVTGDGVSTIRQLVDRENARPERVAVGTGALRVIAVDDHTHELLARSGRTLESVLPAGEQQLIRRTSNASGGGSTADVTDQIHPHNIVICELAAQVTGLDIAGIDFVTPHISRSVLDSGGGIVEINSAPGLIDHLQPGSGTPRDVGGAIVEMLYPPGAQSRAPIVLIAAGQQSRALANALSACLNPRQIVSGVLSTGQITLREATLEPVDESGGIDSLLANPLVEVAIVCLDRDTPVQLPYWDIAIVGPTSELPTEFDQMTTQAARGGGWIVIEAPSSGNKCPDANTHVLPEAIPLDSIAEVVIGILERKHSTP